MNSIKKHSLKLRKMSVTNLGNSNMENIIGVYGAMPHYSLDVMITGCQVTDSGSSSHFIEKFANLR